MKKEELFKAETFDYICNLIKEKLTKFMNGSKEVSILEIKAYNLSIKSNDFEKELQIRFSINLNPEDFCSMVYVDAAWYYDLFDAKEFASIIVSNVLKSLSGESSVRNINIAEKDNDSSIFSVYTKNCK